MKNFFLWLLLAISLFECNALIHGSRYAAKHATEEATDFLSSKYPKFTQDIPLKDTCWISPDSLTSICFIKNDSNGQLSLKFHWDKVKLVLDAAIDKEATRLDSIRKSKHKRK